TLAAACQARPAPLRLWNVATGAERTLTRHTEAIVDVVFHPAGRLAATASADASVRLWDLMPETLLNFFWHFVRGLGPRFRIIDNVGRKAWETEHRIEKEDYRWTHPHALRCERDGSCPGTPQQSGCKQRAAVVLLPRAALASQPRRSLRF